MGALTWLLGELGAPTTCPTAGLLGVPCPGCGLGRATFALLSGEFRTALALHPLVFVVVPALGGGVLLGVMRRLLPRSRAEWVHSLRLKRTVHVGTVGFAVTAIAVWIARFFGAFGGPVPIQPWFW
ncbi:MAG: DUF2752 domain-containing protein [Polyangiaceae bacterium]|nr:DUF2752 domain-containing protein [Polyangiaceae bacterium]